MINDAPRPARLRIGLTLMRGLRFRLAAAFLIFFTLLLVALGLMVRQMLVTIGTNQMSAILDEEWAASKGYLHIEDQTAIWYYDRFDPEEALIVNRITAGGPYLFADAHANIIEWASAPVRALGLDTTSEVRRMLDIARKTPLQPSTEIRKTAQGEEYMIRFGIIPDKEHRQYLLLLGRPLHESLRSTNQFTFRYFAFVPLLVLLCGALGWVVAGRALVPVTDVASAARKITGSNLNVRIPLRGANDELDHLAKAFNRMVERLNYSFEQMRQFSTDVSHELRTPLTAIRGQLEVALFTAETPDQFRDAMANALQDVEQLSNIVRALLLLSQAESGQIVLQLAPVDLAAVLRDIVEQFQIAAEDTHVSLAIETPDNVVIQADKVQMERLVSNLLSNAVKYTPAGGNVRVTLERRGDDAVLRIADNGIGIPAEKLPHIFDRFYRVRPSQSNPVQGLGLGLSFVSWIVNAHHGAIEVDSTVGKGTCFTVRLPVGSPGVTAADNAAPMPDHARL